MIHVFLPKLHRLLLANANAWIVMVFVCMIAVDVHAILKWNRRIEIRNSAIVATVWTMMPMILSMMSVIVVMNAVRLLARFPGILARIVHAANVLNPAVMDRYVMFAQAVL